MGGIENEVMENEFGVLAQWTADAVRVLGPEYAVPAACKGSASPAMLEWLSRTCGLRENIVLTDVGGGLGGPAEFARGEFGARPIVVEPMIAACRAASELFGVPALAAEGARLPLMDDSADVVWCLGVLCTTRDKSALIGEIARVMRPGARLGLLVFAADEPRPAGAPEGNEFPSEEELPGLLGKHGLELTHSVAAADLPDHPDQGTWQRRADEVEALVGRMHAGDARLAEALDQQQRMGGLIQDQVVRAVLVGASVFN
jgi:SAM-dependent methyltransferase